MSEKIIKLQFKPTKIHKNHLDNYNHFTKEGQVGEYPEEIAKEKLADFPNNFIVYKQPAPPKITAKKLPGNPIKDKTNQPKKVEDEPDKMMKEEQTKKK
jgi:hypothetical protein